MTIATKRTANGRLIVTLDGRRAPIDRVVEWAIEDSFSLPIEITNEHGVTCQYRGHIHACIDTYSLYFDCKQLKSAIRRHAERR